MSDDTEQASQAEANQQQAQAATTETPQAGESDEIKKLRKEAASYRTRLRELETAEEQRQAATLSEQEKLAKQAAKLQQERDALATELRTERAKAAIARAAGTLGMDAELAESLALPRLEYDDEGKPTNADKVLKALLGQYPYLAIGATTTANGNGQRQQQRQQPFDPKNPPRLSDVFKR